MQVVRFISFYFVVLLFQTPEAHAAAWKTLKVSALEAHAVYGSLVYYIWEVWWANVEAFNV